MFRSLEISCQLQEQLVFEPHYPGEASLTPFFKSQVAGTFNRNISARLSLWGIIPCEHVCVWDTFLKFKQEVFLERNLAKIHLTHSGCKPSTYFFISAASSLNKSSVNGFLTLTGNCSVFIVQASANSLLFHSLYS